MQALGLVSAGSALGQWSVSGLTAPSTALLALGGLLAMVDWIAVGANPSATRSVRLEYVAKPATAAALLGAAATLHTPDPGRRALFVAALACCLVGDVLLMLPGGRTPAFGGGLGAFLVAQVCFAVGCTRRGAGWPAVLVALAVLGALASFPAARIVTAVRAGAHPGLVGPVVAYVTALLVMGATACAAGVAGSRDGTDPALVAGALLFVVSDTLLATDRFVAPLAHAKLRVHATYHGALVLLVVSLAGVSR